MQNVIELLINSAVSSPNAILYEDNSGTICYQEALDKVKRIACYLSKKSVFRQSILVSAKKNKETLLLFLGIAMSGNCYVPISDDNKGDRLNTIIKTSGAKYSFGIDSDSLVSLSYIDAISEKNDIDIINNFKANFDENLPLYTIFTSGSTGKPKGVIKTHRNMLAFVENFSATFLLPKRIKLCSQTPFCFDASAKDIYLSIALEGSLYIPDQSIFVLPNRALQYLVEKGIEMIMWVPSALINIARVRALSFIKPTELKYIFFIGEVFPPKYLNMWLSALPSTLFVNLYGSTETAGAVLYFEVKNKVDESKMLPIGKPLHNVIAKLENGEICISSDQVALGYLDSEERNKDTFKNEDGKIYLHTGDYGEYDKEGNIVFKSRKDFQIKHLGYRIELQDIENSLSALEYIDICCCIFDKMKDRIVLFAVLSSSVNNSEIAIINDAKKILPLYMVPTKVIVLSSLPLNQNGKVDRVRLNEKYLEEFA